MQSKCRFKHVSELDKQIFRESACLLTISVGQEYHENEKFEATVDLINESFKSCQLMLYDSLQRYTMALMSNFSPDELHASATKQGDFWFERNSHAVERLNISRIIRWNDWLAHPEFNAARSKIEALIQQDPTYKHSFDITANEFLDRFSSRLSESEHINMARAKTLCHNYLVEECSALCLWPETGCYIEVYPNPRNAAMNETHKRFVLPNYHDQLYSVSLKFKHKKQLKAQKFFQSSALLETEAQA